MDDVIFKVGGDMFKEHYKFLDNTSKNVLNNLFVVMERDMNLVHIGGSTLSRLVELTGYNEGTIRKAMVVLNKFHLAEKTSLRGEYIINPLLAVKGDENLVWNVYRKVNDEFNKKRT